MSWIDEYPVVKQEWDYAKNTKRPEEYNKGSHAKVWWIGSSCRHSYFMAISARTRRGSNCNICANRVILIGFNDSATTNPEMIPIFHPTKNTVSLQEVFAGSATKVWWKCNLEHEYSMALLSKKQGLGCPICSGKKVLAGYNDLKTKFPEIVNEWDYEKNTLSPDSVSPFSSKKAWWICSKKRHSYFSSIANRTRLGRGCAECSNQKIVTGSNDFATLHPDLAKEWDDELNGGLLATEVSVGRREPVYWKCREYGHSWNATIRGRILRNHGCPICCNRVVLSGFNDMATTHPEDSKMWHPTKNGKLSPKDVTRFSNSIMVWWRCDKGHEWQCVPNSMNYNKRGTNGCAQCVANSYRSIGEKELGGYIKSLGLSIIETQRKLVSKTEYDIHVPEKNVLVEFNGLFYHSSAYKEQDYHHQKLEKALKANHNLIQVWEDDWRYFREKVELIIKNRMCEFDNIDTKLCAVDESVAFDFLNRFHLDGFIRGEKYFALTNGDAIVSVASTSVSGEHLYIHQHVTLNPFADIIRALVDYSRKNGVIKYIHGTTSNDYFTGEEYEKLGFSIESETNYDLFYLVSGKKKNKLELGIHVRANVDSEISIDEFIKEKNLFEIYNSGHKNWVLEI